MRILVSWAILLKNAVQKDNEMENTQKEIEAMGMKNYLKIIIQNYWKTTIFISQTLNEMN